MAQMEKVTYKPLIELLEENAESLNQLLRTASVVSRKLDTKDVPFWFKQVIEPVFTAVHEQDSGSGRKLFDLLFKDMIKVLSGSEAVVSFENSWQLRLLMGLNPAITAKHPAKLLQALSIALTRISRLNGKAASNWLEVMTKIMPLANDIDEILQAGRIAAWACGMAHLRQQIDFSADINEKILEKIFSRKKVTLDSLKEASAGSEQDEGKSLGGFTGLGGHFSSPPMLCAEKGIVYASDGNRTCAVFADKYGEVMLDCPDHLSESLKFRLTPVKTATARAREILNLYPDLTSWVINEETLMLTTASSHSLFIFGGIDD
jgi:tellurite resistance protein